MCFEVCILTYLRVWRGFSVCRKEKTVQRRHRGDDVYIPRSADCTCNGDGSECVVDTTAVNKRADSNGTRFDLDDVDVNSVCFMLLF